MLIEEFISSGHARALLSVTNNDKQYQLSLRIFDEKMSVRETEKLVKNIDKVKKDKKLKVFDNDFVYRDIEEKIRQEIGTKVSIHRTTNDKGKIMINYYSTEDLEKIMGYFTQKYN